PGRAQRVVQRGDRLALDRAAVVGARERADRLAHLERPPQVVLVERAPRLEAVLLVPGAKRFRAREPLAPVLVVDGVHDPPYELEGIGRGFREVVPSHDTSLVCSTVSNASMIGEETVRRHRSDRMIGVERWRWKPQRTGLPQPEAAEAPSG